MVGFLCYAFAHPESAWPWPNWVTNLLYFVYFEIFAILLAAPFEQGKPVIYKICFILSVTSVAGFFLKLLRDYVLYTSTLNSAPFLLWIVVNSLYYLVPALMLVIAGCAFRRKQMQQVRKKRNLKRALIIAAVILAVIVFGVGFWFYGYHNHKSIDNIPSKELMVTYLKEKGSEYATTVLEGYSAEAVKEVWGEPDGELFGMYGFIWDTGEASILVYFDEENCVTEVKLDAESEAAAAEEHWDLIPMVQVDGVIYIETGIGLMGLGLTDGSESSMEMDGEITSSVEGWEMPAADDQSNFGTGYGYRYFEDEEGAIMLYMNGQWHLFATEEKKQEFE